MTVPSGWNPKGLNPKVLIYDAEGNLQYTFEHDAIDASPTKDFDLWGWNLKLGYGSEMGSLSLYIHDSDKELVDLTDPLIPPEIKNEWKIKFYLGKSSSDLAKWYEGYVRIPTINRSPKYQGLELFSVGLGSILGDWPIIIKYIQKKESDGLTVDATDTTARISALATKILTDTSLYPFASFSTPPFTTNGIETIDNKLPDFIKNYQSIAACLNELANAGDAIWRVNYEAATPDICFHKRGESPSGLLVTNDLSGIKTTGWTGSKLCFLLTRPRSWSESTVDRGYSGFCAIGPYIPALDWDKTTTNAATTLYDSDQQFRVQPTKPNIVQLRMSVIRVGTLAKDMIVYLVAADGSGAPNTSAVYASTIIKKEHLNTLSDSVASYLYVSFEINPAKINPNEYVYIHIPAFGDASNHIVAYRQTGAGVYHKGGAQVGEHKLSTYFGQPIAIHYLDVNAYKKYGKKQTVLSMPEMASSTALEILNGLTERLGRRRRIYEPITVSVPSVPVKPGQTVNVVDSFNGLDTTCVITSMEISDNVYKNKGGAHEMTLNIDEVLT